jgi:tetratricopeptide (TPR) repeat protein
MKYFDARHFTHIGSETIWDRAHNVVLNALATMGVVGLLSYLSIFIIIFYILIKKLREKKIGRLSFGVLSAMIIAYVGQNLFIFDTMANYFMFFLVLGYINYLGFNKEDVPPATSPEAEADKEKSPSIFLITILLILAIILAYQTNVRPSRANFACTRAILAGRTGNAQEAIEKYQEAINYKSQQGAYEIRHKLAAFAIQIADHQRKKNKDFDPSLLYYTLKEVGKNIKTDSLDTIPYLYVGRIYILLIDKEPEAAGEQALIAINKALNLNRNNPRIWYELGQAQLSLRKFDQSYESFKKALELNPKVAISYWFVGITAHQVGHYQEAVLNVEKAMELGYENYKNSIVDLMRLVNIYEKAGNYQKVIESYKLAVEEEPQNPQLYASLAAAYAKVGNYEKALETALKAAEIDPNFREEAEKFIESLGL